MRSNGEEHGDTLELRGALCPIQWALNLLGAGVQEIRITMAGEALPRNRVRSLTCLGTSACVAIGAHLAFHVYRTPCGRCRKLMPRRTLTAGEPCCAEHVEPLLEKYGVQLYLAGAQFSPNIARCRVKVRGCVTGINYRLACAVSAAISACGGRLNH